MRFRACALVVALLAATGCKGKSKQKSTDDKTGSAETSGSATGRPPPLRIRTHAPQVDGPGVEPAHTLSATIYYTPTEISVGDETLAQFRDGLIQPETLTYMVHLLEDKVRSDDPLGLVLDGSLTINRLEPLLATLKRAGFRNLAFVTRVGKLIPIALPDPSELGNGLRPVLTVQAGGLALWSLSGKEGTQPKPVFASLLDKGFEPLTHALGELVKRQWPDGKRSPQDLILTIQIERAQTVDTLMRVIANVRADASRALFPNVFLSVI
jgi:hypothetical protein